MVLELQFARSLAAKKRISELHLLSSLFQPLNSVQFAASSTNWFSIFFIFFFYNLKRFLTISKIIQAIQFSKNFFHSATFKNRPLPTHITFPLCGEENRQIKRFRTRVCGWKSASALQSGKRVRIPCWVVLLELIETDYRLICFQFVAVSVSKNVDRVNCSHIPSTESILQVVPLLSYF